MAIQFTIRKDWLAESTPIRQYGPANIQTALPTFSVRRDAFQAPETPNPIISVTTAPQARTASNGITRRAVTQTRDANAQSTFDAGYALTHGKAPTVPTLSPIAKTAHDLTGGVHYSKDLETVAAESTARKNRQTGLQFQTLFGQTGKGGMTPTASPTSAAWFDVMTDAEKARAAQTKNAVERGKYINSLNLNDRAASQRRQKQDESADFISNYAQIGQYGRGNIDLYNRPQYQYDDGSVATVRSMSFNEDGKEVLVPTIAFDRNGKPVELSDNEAIDLYRRTGQYLGKFDTVEDADAYADALHRAQDYRYNYRNETGNPSGQAIAAYVQAGDNLAKQRNALDMMDTVGRRALASDLDNLNESQKSTIASLAKSGDYQAVADYIDNIQYKLLAQERESLVEKNKTLGYEHPVYSVIPEGAYNTVNGVSAILDVAAKKATELLTHEWTPIDPNSHIYDMVAASQAISEGANERISNIQDPNLRRAAQVTRSGISSFITNGIQVLAGGAIGKGMGLANTAEKAALAEFTSNFTLAVMGTSAAGQTAYRKLKEGGTSAEALSEGLATGIIETLSEKWSLDRFVKSLPSLTSGNAKQRAMRFLKEFAVQGGIEGLEEVTGNIADQTWDILYNGQNSEYSLRTQAILAQKIMNSRDPENYKPTQQDIQSAREQAFTDLWVTQSVDAFLSAVVSSFLLTGAPTVSSYGIDNITSKQNTRKFGTALKQADLTYSEINKAEMFPDTKAAEMAEKLREKADKGKYNVNGYQLGKLATLTNIQVTNAVNEMLLSDNAQIQDYAGSLITSGELQSKYLTPVKLAEILDIYRNGFPAEETAPSPTPTPQAVQQTQQAQPVQQTPQSAPVTEPPADIPVKPPTLKPINTEPTPQSASVAVRNETAPREAQTNETRTETQFRQEQPDKAKIQSSEKARDDLLTGRRRVNPDELTIADYNGLAELDAQRMDNGEPGRIGVDAKGDLFMIDPEQHIDNRVSENMGSRKINAFQYDHPELRKFYREAAEVLAIELEDTQPGERIFVPDTTSGQGFHPAVIGNKRQTTPRIAKLLDEYRMTYQDIGTAIDAIIKDEGAENRAAAKRLELVIDDMLTNGYQRQDRYSREYVEPNQAYIRAKQRIYGAYSGEAAAESSAEASGVAQDVRADERVIATEESAPMPEKVSGVSVFRSQDSFAKQAYDKNGDLKSGKLEPSVIADPSFPKVNLRWTVEAVSKKMAMVKFAEKFAPALESLAKTGDAASNPFATSLDMVQRIQSDYNDTKRLKDRSFDKWTSDYRRGFDTLSIDTIRQADGGRNNLYEIDLSASYDANIAEAMRRSAQAESEGKFSDAAQRFIENYSSDLLREIGVKSVPSKLESYIWDTVQRQSGADLGVKSIDSVRELTENERRKHHTANATLEIQWTSDHGHGGEDTPGKAQTAYADVDIDNLPRFTEDDENAERKPIELNEVPDTFDDFWDSDTERSQTMNVERNPTLTQSLPDEYYGDAGSATGAAERGYSGDTSVQEEMERLSDQYGEMRPERTDQSSIARGVLQNPIPSRTSPNTYVGRNTQNQTTAPGIAKERMSDYDEGIVRGYFDQTPLTHKEMREAAQSLLARHNNNLEWARKYLLDKVSDHKMLTLTDIALFQETLVNLSHTDMKTQDYLEFAATLNDYASYLGHGLNLLNLLRQIDPDFQIIHAQSQIQKLNDEFAEKGRSKAKNVNKADNEAAEQAVDEAQEEGLKELEDPNKAKRRRRKRRPKKANAAEQAVDEAQEEDDFTKRFVESMRKRVESVYKRAKPTTQEQLAMKDLLRIAEGYDLPKRPAQKPRTAVDRLRAFYGNRQQFTEAWTAAQEALRNRYAQEGESGAEKLQALDGFLNKNFGYVSPHERATATGGTVEDPVTAGVLSAILHSDPGIAPKDVSMRAFLQDSATLEQKLLSDVVSQIQDFRDETGAERHIDLSESDHKTLEIAVREYIFDKYREGLPRFIWRRDGTVKLTSGIQARLDSDIRAAVRDAGTNMANIIRQGNADKAVIAQRISDMLLNKYGVSFEGRETAGEIIVRQFNQRVAQLAQEALEKTFREKNGSKSITNNQDRILKQFTELANMGAFTSGNYREQAAAKIFGHAHIVIDPALIEEFRNAKNDSDKNAVIEKIQQNVADQIPATLGEKITALRYIGMLGSLKTIVSRNAGGNLVFQPVVAAKNAVAAGIESAARALGVKIEKTRTVAYSLDDYNEWAKDFGDLKSKQVSEVRRLIMQGGKYSDNSTPNTFMQGVQEKRTIFGRNDDIISKSAGRLLEWERRKITDIMDWGDALFARHTYAATAARYLKAQGVTFQTATEAQKQAAREIAVREAAEATYRDNSDFAVALSRLRYSGDNKAMRFISGIGEGIMPFRKTPANIAVRAFEYSPFGIVKSGVDAATMKFGANRMTGNDLINEFAKGLTGTGLFLLGMFLKRFGLLTGTGPLDDMKKRGFMQLEGWQPYSFRFKIGNRYRYYNADWMAPEAIPLFLGANFAEALDDEGFDFWQGAKVAMTLGDPLIKMSMLSGVNDALADAASYGDTEYAVMKFVANAYWSGFTQMATPQIWLQGARMINNIRRTTFTDKNSPLPAAVQRANGRIPYLNNPNRMDYIDMWGRTQENYVTPAGNAVAQFLSPSYQSIEEIGTDTRRMEQALSDLYDRTGEKGVLPTAAKSSFNLNGATKNMTKAEFITYSVRKGQTAHDLMQELTSNPVYGRLNDAQKIAAVERVYDYADGTAKESIWGNADNPEERFSADSWISKADALSEQYGIPVSTFVAARAVKLRAENIYDSEGESVKTKVHYQKTEDGKQHQKTSNVSAGSIRAALEIRQAVQFTGSDANKKYKALFESLEIAEALRGKSEDYLQRQLNNMEKKGSAS